MSRLIDLTGKTFGYLTVIQKGETGPTGQTRWECACRCGKPVTVDGYRLRNGKTKSCGCYRKETTQKRADDLSGKVFGRLTVLRRSEQLQARGFYPWICRCECGNIKNIKASDLKAGTTMSCGCLNDEKRRE